MPLDSMVSVMMSAEVGSVATPAAVLVRNRTVRSPVDVDTTADDSPDYTKTSLVTFKMVEFSGDGVSYTDTAYNQNTLRAHVISPGSGTGNQPKAWLRMTDPDGSVYVGPFIITEWSDERGHASESTWSLSAKSNGSVTFTPA